MFDFEKIKNNKEPVLFPLLGLQTNEFFSFLFHDL